MNLGLSTFMEVLALLVLIMWLNHVISCMWYSIGRYAWSDTRASWLDLEAYQNGPSYGDSGMQYQYFTSLHWSLTQMTPGSMQVNPQNSAERAFNVVCLTFGLLFFSSVVSSISGRLMQYTIRKTGQTTKLAELDRFMRQANVSTALRIGIQKQAALRMAIQKPLVVNEIEALHLVSLSLKAELQSELCQRHLQSHSVLNLMIQMDQSFARDVCNTAIAFQVLNTGDTLFLAGTDANEAYYCYRGSLKYTQDPMTSRIAQRKDFPVPTNTWLCEMALWAHWVHVGEAEAHEMMECMCIKAEELRTVLRRHDTVQQVTTEYADLFYECVVSAHPPRESWPSDMYVPHTSWDEMVFAMGTTARMAVGLLSIDIIKAQQSRGIYGLPVSKIRVSDLETEVRDGVTALCIEAGMPTRIIIGTSVKLRNAEDLTILVQIAKYQNGDKKVHARLPGLRRHLGESTRAGLKRLTNGKMQPFLGGMQHGEVQRFDEVRRAMDGMRTKQIAEVHNATLKSSFLPIGMIDCVGHQSPYRTFAYRYGSCIYIYSWMPEVEFHRLHGDRGTQEISSWLDRVDFSDGDLGDISTAFESYPSGDGSMDSDLSVTPRRHMGHEDTLFGWGSTNAQCSR